mgnify:CR=1 FL=1
MTQPRSGDDSPVDGDRILWEGSSTARWPAVLAGLMALWALVIVVWLPPAWPVAQGGGLCEPPSPSTA